MSTHARSARAVRTLVDVDPDFTELCKMLYGEAVDADEVWADVFGKSSPDQADVGTHRNPEVMQGRLSTAERRLRRRRNGRLVPRDDVDKAAPSLGQLANGNMQQMRAATGMAAQTAAQPQSNRVAQASQRAASSQTSSQGGQGSKARHAKRPQHAAPKPSAGGQLVRSAARGLEAATATTGRKVATGGALAAGAYGLHRRRSSAAGAEQGGGAYYQPYAVGYGKAEGDDVTWEGTFSKLDDDKRLAFGWCSVVSVNGEEVVDKQGDYIEPEDMEKAAYEYVIKSRVGGDMHRRASRDTPGRTLHEADEPHKVSDLVESFVTTPEKIEKMGLPQSTPIGWWVGFKVHDPETWDLVKKGERTGFSIHGKGRRQDRDAA